MSSPDSDTPCRYFSYTLQMRTVERVTLAVESAAPLVVHASELGMPAPLSGTGLMNAREGRRIPEFRPMFVWG